MHCYRAAALLALALVAGCGRGGGTEDPEPVPPDLSGADVMVLPAQRPEATLPADFPGRLDAEIAFWAVEVAPGLRWVFPPELDRAVGRTATMDMSLRLLPVGQLRDSGLDHVTDPLLGQLRRLGAVVDRRYALLPVEVGVVGEGPAAGAVRIRLVLLDTVGGKVLWRGQVVGDPAPLGSSEAAASAARALAREFLR